MGCALPAPKLPPAVLGPMLPAPGNPYPSPLYLILHT